MESLKELGLHQEDDDPGLSNFSGSDHPSNYSDFRDSAENYFIFFKPASFLESPLS